MHTDVKAAKGAANARDQDPGRRQAEQEVDDAKRRVCPGCGHRTSKPACRRCEPQPPRPTVAEAGAPKAECADYPRAGDLQRRVQRWVSAATVEMESPPSRARYVAEVSPDGGGASAAEHVAAVVQAIACHLSQPGAIGGLPGPRPQPGAVAVAVEPVISAWSPLVRELGQDLDGFALAEALIRAVKAGVAEALGTSDLADCVIVGILKATRDADLVRDDDLLSGCRGFVSASRAMSSFVRFLGAEGEEGETDGER